MSSEKLRDEGTMALERQGAGRESLVPASYAEKAMSSLLRLHEDLVEEKEKRIDLYRRLMEREQSLAELRAYVKLLEGELARRGFDPTAYALDPVEAPAPTTERYRAVAQAVGAEAPRAARGAQVEPPPPAPAAPAPPHDGPGPVIAWTPAGGKIGAVR